MPTASKLVAAVLFAAVAALAAWVYIPLLPEGTQTRLLVPITAAIGLGVGWWVMGPNTGKSYAEAAATGLRTSLSIVFCAVLGFAIYVMLMRSTKMIYDGPMEAVLAVFAVMLEYGKLMGDANYIGVLVAGGILGGLITEFVGRRWS